MTPQKLRQSIIDYALTGKLTNLESTGDDVGSLLERLANAKYGARKGTNKKSLLDSNPSTDDLLFEIPPSWNWVKLGSLITLSAGLSYDKKDVSSMGVRVLRGGNVQGNALILSDDDVFLPEKYFDQAKELRKGDTIIVASTGSKAVLGKPAYVMDDMPNVFVGAFLRICRPNLIEMSRYINLLFNSSLIRERIRSLSKGTNINNIKEAMIVDAFVPLPPLAVQKRIVEKIETLMPLVDEYEQIWNKLESLNQRVANNLRRSIFQFALRGKVVEQRDSEGTGFDLLNKIKASPFGISLMHNSKTNAYIGENNSEPPFDIPVTWAWCKVGELVSIKSGEPLTSKQMKAGDVPVYGGNGITGYHNEWLVDKETIVIGRVGYYCGSVQIAKAPAWITDNAFMVSYPEAYINRSFLVYFLEALDLGKSNNATAQPVVSGKKIYPLYFPLPPLGEQKRIAHSLDLLLDLCSELDATQGAKR